MSDLIQKTDEGFPLRINREELLKKEGAEKVEGVEGYIKWVISSKLAIYKPDPASKKGDSNIDYILRAIPKDLGNSSC